MVRIPPGWPVFHAFKSSKAVPSRTSPTTIREGLSRIETITHPLIEALKTVDEAIEANTHIPDELYFVPKNLAIKAEIEQKLGNAKESDELYRKSAALIDVMLAHAPTQNVERIVLGEMGSVYSGYFASLCAQKKYDSAFHTLEED